MGEHKKGWRSGRISDEQSHLLFAHCTSVGPSRIRKAGGLDPKFSEKDVLDDGDWQGTHQFVYAFVSDDPPKGAPKGARTMGWGVAGNYMYTFHQPAGTVYLCHMGVIGRSEIAFPQLIPYQNLTGYKIEKLLTLKPISMKGCCFITTATCEALGLDDDCEELATKHRIRPPSTKTFTFSTSPQPSRRFTKEGTLRLQIGIASWWRCSNCDLV